MLRFKSNLYLATVLLLALPLPVANGQVSVTTVDGTEITGDLLAWNAKGVTVSSADNSESLNLDQILAIRWLDHELEEESNKSSIELTDGAVLPISSFLVTNAKAEVTTPLLKDNLQLSTAAIRRVQFTTLTGQLTNLWSELEEKQLAGDILVVNKKSGTVLDYLTGLLGDISSEQVNFKWEGDEIPVKWSKVAALAYYHAQQPEFEPAICQLQTQNGASLPVATATFAEGILTVTTVSGLEFHLPQDALLSADFSQGKVSYLSDLQPIKQTWTPRIALPANAELIQGFGQPRKDQTFAGSALTLAWPTTADTTKDKLSENAEVRTYNKGLAIRSRTEIIYRLPSQMQRFVAIAGIDPTTAGQGNVTLEIYADEQLVWQGEITGDSQPTEIEAPIDGARQLRILVDYGTNLDYGDQLHLVEARVTK